MVFGGSRGIGAAIANQLAAATSEAIRPLA